MLANKWKGAFSANRAFYNESNKILRQTFLFCIAESISDKLLSILFLIHTRNQQTICKKAWTETEESNFNDKHYSQLYHNYVAIRIWMA